MTRLDHRHNLAAFWLPIYAVEGLPGGSRFKPLLRRALAVGPFLAHGALQAAAVRAGQESEIPNFKGSYLGRFPLVSADFWTSDHLSGRSRSVDAFFGTRARGTLTLNRR